jgi:1,4-dihydroxy-2-naphthoyl-CoA hydrolase
MFADAPPEVAEILRGGMPQALGIRVTSVAPQGVTGEMTIAAIHCNPNGNVNGGAIMAFADTLGAVGAAANRPKGYRGGTIESKTNFLVPAAGPVLSGLSVSLHSGRTTSVWQTTIRDSAGKSVAVVTQTQISLPAKPAAAIGKG